jgi:hypothetical protein
MCENVRGIIPFSYSFSWLPSIVNVFPQPAIITFCTCLSIGKDGAIIALNYRFNQVEDSLFIDRRLCTALWIHRVIGKVFLICFLTWLTENDLIVSLVD